MMKYIPRQQFVVVVSLLWSFAASLEATEKQIAELEEETAALKAQLSEVAPAAEEISALSENVAKAEEEIARITESLQELEKSIVDKQFLLSAYQAGYRVVSTLTPGQALEPFQLPSGELVSGALFAGTVKGGINVQTQSGLKTIPLGELPGFFRDRVNLPPQTPPLSTSSEALLASKPDSLKPPADRGAKAKTPSPVASSAPAGDAAQPVAAGQTSAPAAPDYEAIRLRNQERQRKIAEMKLQFSELFTQKKLAREAKASDERRFREAKIKKSQNEVNSTIKMHDDKIRKIEMEESKLRTEIARLQAQME